MREAEREGRNVRLEIWRHCSSRESSLSGDREDSSPGDLSFPVILVQEFLCSVLPSFRPLSGGSEDSRQ